MSPVKPKTQPTPTTDVTPESAMDALQRELTALGVFGGGQRRQALMVAGQRLHKALEELKAAEAHAAALRAGMTQLTQDAIDAVAGVAKPKAPKAAANGVAPSTPTTDASKAGAQ